MSNVIAFIPRARAPEEVLRQGVELLVRAIESPRYDACISAIQKRIKATKDEDDKAALSHLYNILTDARLNIIVLFESCKSIRVENGSIQSKGMDIAAMTKAMGIEQGCENADDRAQFILSACKTVLGIYEDILWECERFIDTKMSSQK